MINPTPNRLERGETLRAAYLSATADTIDINALNLSGGVCQTTRGVYYRKPSRRRMAYFESACALDGSGSITVGVVAQPYVTNTGIWQHALGDNIIRFIAPGRYEVIFRYSLSLTSTGSPYYRQFVAVSQTLDNSLVATDLFWQSWASINATSIPTASGSISCVLNSKTDLTDGGFKIRYTLTGTGGTFTFHGNISIVGPLI